MLRFPRGAVLFSVAVSFVVAPFASAQLTTFAQFLQNGGGNAFNYTSQGTAGQPGGSASLSTSNTALFFTYTSIVGLPVDLTGIQNAHITFTSFTTLGPTVSSNGFDEVFNGSGGNSAMITISRDTPAAEGNGSRTILLQVIFTPFTFSGSGGSGAFSASSLSGSVTFASDFLDFSNTIQRDLGLSFSSISPPLSIGANGFFNSFTAAGTGTFSSNPVPMFIPEPSTYLMMGVALVGLLGYAVRRRRLVPARVF
jgi:hypothetical protein